VKGLKVDRLAWPWLINRFVDPETQFLFVPAEAVIRIANDEGAIAFDVPGVGLTHYKEGGNERVSFDAIIRRYDLKDPALLKLARIVRGADAKIPDGPIESAGLEAAALGSWEIAKDGFENMKIQFPLYDALCEYCRLKVQGVGKLEHSTK
jgi:hypothetical protein